MKSKFRDQFNHSEWSLNDVTSTRFLSHINISRTWGVKPAELTASQILQTDSTDYLMNGNLILKNGRIDRYLFDGGYAKASVASPTTDSFSFYYYNQDHLGNVREVVDASGNILQVTNYYPSGTPYFDASSTKNANMQPYKYNGKELDRMHGLDTYDYGARQYDPILMRWDRIDPLCEKNYNISPYAYCANNPVKYVDPDGRDYSVSVDFSAHIITINATYYTLSNSYESAQHAVDIINQQSGNYSYDVDGVSYTVNFNLNAVDIGSNEAGELNYAYMNDDTGYANTYQVVPDDYKRMDSNTNGTTFGGKDILVKSSRSMTETGGHEIGHSLGLLHKMRGLMTSESSSDNRSNFLDKLDIKEMIKFPIKGKRNGNAGRGILMNPVNRKFWNGSVIKRKEK